MIERILGTREFTGWHMFGVLVLFFGTIVSVNLTLAFYANSTWTGLVVKNTYVESQLFNEKMVERQRQLAMGWKGIADYSNGALTIDLKDDRARIVNDAIVVVKLGRAAHENDDHIVQLQQNAAGAYAVDTHLASGLWQAEVSVTGPKGEVWTNIYRFTVKG